MLKNNGGWGRRIHRALLELTADLQAADKSAAIGRLQSFDGIGSGRAETIYGAVTRNRAAIEAGNMEAGGPGIRLLVRTLAESVVDEQNAPIDEPVTTEVRRLIRLPGTLHGGSGLVVTSIDRDDLDAFEPLSDAIPNRFVGQEITIETAESRTVELNGDKTKIPQGVSTVPEYLGVFLMTRGEATKAPEPT